MSAEESQPKKQAGQNSSGTDITLTVTVKGCNDSGTGRKNLAKYKLDFDDTENEIIQTAVKDSDLTLEEWLRINLIFAAKAQLSSSEPKKITVRLNDEVRRAAQIHCSRLHPPKQVTPWVVDIVTQYFCRHTFYDTRKIQKCLDAEPIAGRRKDPPISPQFPNSTATSLQSLSIASGISASNIVAFIIVAKIGKDWRKLADYQRGQRYTHDAQQYAK